MEGATLKPAPINSCSSHKGNEVEEYQIKQICYRHPREKKRLSLSFIYSRLWHSGGGLEVVIIQCAKVEELAGPEEKIIFFEI